MARIPSRAGAVSAFHSVETSRIATPSAGSGSRSPGDVQERGETRWSIAKAADWSRDHAATRWAAEAIPAHGVREGETATRCPPVRFAMRDAAPPPSRLIIGRKERASKRGRGLCKSSKSAPSTPRQVVIEYWKYICPRIQNRQSSEVAELISITK